MNINNLPPEISVHIDKFLNYNDQLNLKSTSRKQFQYLHFEISQAEVIKRLSSPVFTTYLSTPLPEIGVLKPTRIIDEVIEGIANTVVLKDAPPLYLPTGIMPIIKEEGDRITHKFAKHISPQGLIFHNMICLEKIERVISMVDDASLIAFFNDISGNLQELNLINGNDVDLINQAKIQVTTRKKMNNANEYNFAQMRQMSVEDEFAMHELADSIRKYLRDNENLLAPLKKITSRSISKEIAFFKGVTHADFSYSTFRRIPGEILNLTELVLLRLGLNENIDQLPEGLSQLANLRHLALYSCFRITKLPSDTDRILPNLEEISLPYEFEDMGYTGLIPDELRMMVNGDDDDDEEINEDNEDEIINDVNVINDVNDVNDVNVINDVNDVNGVNDLAEFNALLFGEAEVANADEEVDTDVDTDSELSKYFSNKRHGSDDEDLNDYNSAKIPKII